MTAHIITQKDINPQLEATGTLDAETDKAVCISGIWFPKSQMDRREEYPDQIGFYFNEWILSKKWDDIVDADIVVF